MKVGGLTLIPRAFPACRPQLMHVYLRATSLPKCQPRSLQWRALAGVPVTIENPHSSRLWETKWWARISRWPNIDVAVLDYCAFGTPWRKRTRFLSANVILSSIQGRCEGRRVCSFTRRPHTILSGTDEAGRRLTTLAEPYPARLCRSILPCFETAIVQQNASHVCRFMTV